MADQYQDNQPDNTQGYNQAPEPQKAKEPVDRINDSGISAAVWENEGKHGKFHNVTLSRSYKNSEGHYQNTDSFRKQDLPVLMEVVRGAYASIREREQSNRRDQTYAAPNRSERRAAFEAKRGPEPSKSNERER